jgi:sec-independent protein translocase protein TatA
VPFNLSGWELLVVLVIALLLFGRRLPEVGRSMGKTIVEFKKGLKSVEEDVKTEETSTAYRPPLTASGEDRRVISSAQNVSTTPGQSS